MQDPIIGVIGFGRFGQFWAKTLQATHQVLVTDQQDRAAEAAAMGVSFRQSAAAICAEADVIFFCVPISQMEPVVAGLKPHLRPGTIVFDTCSVKSYPAQILQTHLGQIEQVALIVTHPMFGPDSGAAGLAGLPIVMWPLQSPPPVYEEWRAYFSQIGLKVVEMSPEAHDQAVANSQGITHYIGRVLGEMDLQPTPIDTKGFQLLSAVIEQTCNDTWELFHDLQNYNPYTKTMRLQLEDALDQVYSTLLPEQVSPGTLLIGVQGGQGSFSEEASRYYCAQHQISDVSIAHKYTSLNVLAALHHGEIDRGVFAIQSARGGVVMETIAALSRYSCQILDYFEMALRHAIMHHPSVTFAQIDTLVSHPQSLSQCRATLQRTFPQLRQVSLEGDLIDQALGAQQIAAGTLPPTTAVLAPQSCADLYGLTLHATDLQDLGDENYTTFVWVKRRDVIASHKPSARNL